MGQLPDLQEARRRLGLALSPLCHDRWILGFLREGWVQPIAASEVSRRFLQGRPLMPLGRRALYEKKPAVINSLFEKPELSDGYNWELDWPAILYAPISQIGQRPIGLLTIGCRRDHWYTEQDVAYAHTLGITLAPLVAALRGPLGQLNESEGEVAQLLSYGLSAAEIARAIKTDDRQARRLVDSVTKKLQTISATDLEFPIVQMRKRAFRL
ncbi:MAG TPA: GAF domain-containing protein [Candidatus Dormibacteraeota bacterium]|jgi:DNA-binding CsgD family transcriptional regulator|nr:GAF domain-containing protein [Candidatus Dormibacteraeota bacterium]